MLIIIIITIIITTTTITTTTTIIIKEGWEQELETTLGIRITLMRLIKMIFLRPLL